MSFKIFKKITLVNFEVEPHENISIIKKIEPSGYKLNKTKQVYDPSEIKHDQTIETSISSLIKSLPQNNLPPYKQNIKYIKSYGENFNSDWKINKNIIQIDPLEPTQVINIEKIETDRSKNISSLRRALECEEPYKISFETDPVKEYIYIKEIINFK